MSPLYTYDNKILKLSTGPVLASGENCCCKKPTYCKCCSNGLYPPAWTVRVVGVVESPNCNSAGDNCASLNRIYVFYGITAESCSGNDNWCSISETLNLSSGEIQFCGYIWGGYATLLWEAFRSSDETYSVGFTFEVWMYTDAEHSNVVSALVCGFTRYDLNGIGGPACGVPISYKDAASQQNYAGLGACSMDTDVFNVVLFPTS